MKVVFLAFGSRGDVQPMLALALGLQRAGHDVFLSAPRNFDRLAAEYGMPFRPMSFDFRELLDRPEVKRAIASGKMHRLMAVRGMRFLGDVLNLDAYNATRDADAVVYPAGPPEAAFYIARQRRIPAIRVSCLPLEPSREQPPLVAGRGKRHGPAFNGLVSGLTFWLYSRMRKASVNRFLRDFLQAPRLPRFGLPPEFAPDGPAVYIYSATLLPKPADWRPDAHVIGYPFLDEPPGWQPPEDLCRFLDSGPTPVLVGFGSLPLANPSELHRVILEAVRRSGVRTVLQSGWGRLGEGERLPGNVFPIGSVPYRWLLPRMAAVVHHGGIGTLADALRAGVPTVIVPHHFSQPYFARRARELGVCPEPLPLKDISADALAAAIHSAMTDRALAVRVAEVGARIRAEQGVERFAELFAEYVQRFRGQPDGTRPCGRPLPSLPETRSENMAPLPGPASLGAGPAG